MGAPRSTKYRRRSTDRIEVARRFVHALPGRALRPGTAALERLLFGSGVVGSALRALARRLLARDLAITRDAFEADFYLAQCEDPREHAFAAIDPQLHYTAIGRARRRSPARAFDPIHYRRFSAGLSKLRDPFAHWLTIGRAAGHSTNAVDGIRRAGRGATGEAVLVVDHPRGGGSTRYIALFEAAIRAEGRGVVRLRHVAGTSRLALWDDLDRPAGDDAPPPIFDLFADEDAFVAHARATGIARILVNHPIDRPIEIFAWIVRVAERIGCRFDLILHDFYTVCPRVNAVDGEGRFCGLPPVETCRPCIETWGSEMGGVDPAVWRGEALACVRAADHVWVPSRDTADRLDRFLDGKHCDVWEPESDAHHPPEIVPVISADRPLRLTLIGAVNVPKGSQVLLGVADAARRRGAPITFTVLGPTDETAALTALGVKVHGRYDSGDLPRLLAEAAPDAIFLPAIWPETWSFVLGHALDLGLPVIAFDIGAPADRLRGLGRGRVLPTALASDPDGLLDALMGVRRDWEAAP